MTWTITIATFLGTAVAVLLVLFIFSRRAQIRQRVQEALREQRRERRIPAEVTLELSSLAEPYIYEKVPTENASRHGARVVSEKPWLLNERIVVRLPRADRHSRARIAYCRALPEGSFAIGLQFFSVLEHWLISRTEMLGHPYRT